MKFTSANILREGKSEIRAIGDVCDPVCFTWYGCAHSKPNGVCEGFVLMNGETRKHLNKILNEDDAIYVQNCVNRIQNGSNEEGLVSEVLRYLPPQEPERKEGFLAMLEASHPNNPTRETIQPEPEERASSGFSAMLSASSKGVERQSEQPQLMRRQMSFDYENQLPLICTESCPIKRHCGSFPSNEGSVCVKQTEQYKNKYFVRSMK